MKSQYIKVLEKFWRKQLNHIKMPMKRKRKMVAQYAFATMVRHKSGGLSQYQQKFINDSIRSHIPNDTSGFDATAKDVPN